MNHAAGIFFSAVFAVILIGTASAGAADEPVATAPIPPPLLSEPLSPATPMMIPATPSPKPDSLKPKTDASGRAAEVPKTKPETAAVPQKKPEHQRPEIASSSPRQKPETTARARRSKRPVSQHAATRKTPRGKLAAEKAAAEEAAIAAAAEAAERDTARQRAAELGRGRYQSARRARPQATPEAPAWAASPDGDMAYDNGTYGGRADDGGTNRGGGTYPPSPIGSGRSGYYAEYPRRPMFYGPAYPPPWYNGPRPEYYPDESYPNRWGGGPMPRW